MKAKSTGRVSLKKQSKKSLAIIKNSPQQAKSITQRIEPQELKLSNIITSCKNSQNYDKSSPQKSCIVIKSNKIAFREEKDRKLNFKLSNDNLINEQSPYLFENRILEENSATNSSSSSSKGKSNSHSNVQQMINVSTVQTPEDQCANQNDK